MLEKTQNSLTQQWTETSTKWADEKGIIFERDHFNMIDMSITEMLRILIEFEKLIEESEKKFD